MELDSRGNIVAWVDAEGKRHEVSQPERPPESPTRSVLPRAMIEDAEWGMRAARREEREGFSVQGTVPGTLSAMVERYERGEITAQELSTSAQGAGYPAGQTRLPGPYTRSQREAGPLGRGAKPDQVGPLPVSDLQGPQSARPEIRTRAQTRLPGADTGAGGYQRPGLADVEPRGGGYDLSGYSEYSTGRADVDYRSVSGIMQAYEEGTIPFTEAQAMLRGLGVDPELLDVQDVKTLRYRPGPGESPLGLFDPDNYRVEDPRDVSGEVLEALGEGGDALIPFEMSIPWSAPFFSAGRGLARRLIDPLTQADELAKLGLTREDALPRILGRTVREGPGPGTGVGPGASVGDEFFGGRGLGELGEDVGGKADVTPSPITTARQAETVAKSIIARDADGLLVVDRPASAALMKRLREWFRGNDDAQTALDRLQTERQTRELASEQARAAVREEIEGYRQPGLADEVPGEELDEIELARRERERALAAGQTDMFGAESAPAKPATVADSLADMERRGIVKTPKGAPPVKRVAPPPDVAATPADEAPAGLSATVERVSFDELVIREDLFQAREKDAGSYFLQDNVDAILAKGFNWGEFHPLWYWRVPETAEKAVLGGHHRHAILAQLFAQSGRREFFDNIPVQEFKGTLEEAIEASVESNFSIVEMTLIGRVTSAAKLRALGRDTAAIATKLKLSTTQVNRLLALEDSGMPVLIQLSGQLKQGTNRAEEVAVAIGRWRQDHPDMTDNQALENFLVYTSDPDSIPSQAAVVADLKAEAKLLEEAGIVQPQMFAEGGAGEAFSNPMLEARKARIQALADLDRETNSLKALRASLNKRGGGLGVSDEAKKIIAAADQEIERIKSSIELQNDVYLDAVRRQQAGEVGQGAGRRADATPLEPPPPRAEEPPAGTGRWAQAGEGLQELSVEGTVYRLQRMGTNDWQLRSGKDVLPVFGRNTFAGTEDEARGLADQIVEAMHPGAAPAPPVAAAPETAAPVEQVGQPVQPATPVEELRQTVEVAHPRGRFATSSRIVNEAHQRLAEMRDRVRQAADYSAKAEEEALQRYQETLIQTRGEEKLLFRRAAAAQVERRRPGIPGAEERVAKAARLSEYAAASRPGEFKPPVLRPGSESAADRLAVARQEYEDSVNKAKAKVRRQGSLPVGADIANSSPTALVVPEHPARRISPDELALRLDVARINATRRIQEARVEGDFRASTSLRIEQEEIDNALVRNLQAGRRARFPDPAEGAGPVSRGQPGPGRTAAFESRQDQAAADAFEGQMRQTAGRTGQGAENRARVTAEGQQARSRENVGAEASRRREASTGAHRSSRIQRGAEQPPADYEESFPIDPARATPPPGGKGPGAPEGMFRTPPVNEEDLAPKLPAWSVILDYIKSPNYQRNIAAMPGANRLFSYINPRLIAHKDPLASATHAFVARADQGTNLARVIVAMFRAKAGPFKNVFGNVNLTTGRFTNGAFKGELFMEVLENRNKFSGRLTDRHNRWLRWYDDFNEAKLQKAIDAGLDVKALELEDDMFFAPRRYLMKEAPDGSIIEWAYVGPRRPSSPEGKPGFTRHRYFKTYNEAHEAGFRSADPEQVMFVSHQSLERSISEKMLYKHLVDDGVIGTGKLGPEGTRFGEVALSSVNAPSFRKSGRVIRDRSQQPTGKDAYAILRMMNDVFDDTGSVILAPIETANRWLRIGATGFDAGVMMIQLLPFFPRRGLIGLTSIRDGILSGLGRNAVDNLINEDPALYASFAKYGGMMVSQGGTDQTAIMARYGPGNRMARAGRWAYGPFARYFEASLDTAGLRLWKSLTKGRNLSDHDLYETAAFINDIRGVSSPTSMGASLKVRQLEGVVMFAPRYNRAIAALLLDFYRGGVRGRQAREHLVSFAVGMSALGYGFGLAAEGGDTKKALEYINPTSPKFFTWEVGGQQFGIGGKMRSLMRLMGRIGARTYDQAGDSEYFTARETAWAISEPGFDWLRSNLSPGVGGVADLLYGRNFIGEPTRDSLGAVAKSVGERGLPFYLSSFAFDGGTFSQRASRFGAEFVGARAYANSPKVEQILYYEEKTGKDWQEISKGEKLELENADPEAVRLKALAEADRAEKGAVTRFTTQLRSAKETRLTGLEEDVAKLKEGRVGYPQLREAIQRRGRDYGAVFEHIAAQPENETLMRRMKERPREIPEDEAYRQFMSIMHDDSYDRGIEGYDYDRRDAALALWREEIGEELWQSVQRQRELERRVLPTEVQMYYKDMDYAGLRIYWGLADQGLSERQVDRQRIRMRRRDPLLDAILHRWYGHVPTTNVEEGGNMYRTYHQDLVTASP